MDWTSTMIQQTLLHLYKTRFAVKEKKRKKA